MEPESAAPAAREAAPAEAAARYRVPLPTVYRWAQQGIIKARKTGDGRGVLVDLDDIAVLARARTRRYDHDLAARLAKALLPLTGSQRRRLAELLLPGQGRHDAA